MGEFFAGIIIGTVCCTIVFISISTPLNVWQGKVVSKGYGLYCPLTGDFAFVEECDD